MTKKELSFLLWLTAFIIILAFAAGCRSAQKHLELSEWHKDKAIERGATVKKDTIQFHLKSPEIKFNTTIKPNWQKLSLSKDTLKHTDKKTGAIVKAKIDLRDECPEDCIETVYLEAECPPQDLTVDVPCETVQAGYSLWDIIILVIFMIPGGWLIMNFIVIPLVRKINL